MSKDEEKKKPKYNMWQSTKYMLHMALRSHLPGVIVLCVLGSVLQVCSSLTGLFLSPMILRCVEEEAPLAELIATIVVFSVLLMVLNGASTYAGTRMSAGKISVRTGIIKAITLKRGTTSYPNLEEQKIVKLQKKAFQATSGNSEATEAVWQTYSDILKNIAGFIIYLLMLSAINPVIIAITVATTVAGYLVNRHNKKWTYHHREEEAEYINKSWYILGRAQNVKFAKDLRIFGMREWLMDVYESNMKLYMNFFARKEKNRLTADFIKALLAFLRNGTAYIYLISLTVKQNLPASQFLLYFSMVGGFTAWIGGILDCFTRLYEQNLDLSTVQEYLDTPEPFLFDEGEHIVPESFSSYKLELKDVSFRYPGADKDTLHHVNLLIEPGEKLAVVGLNGAGKTTLVKLLCGFYDPTEGQVLLNDRDIREFNRRDYYSLFSAVFQQFSVLETTLAENVAQTDENIDMERVRDCIEKAGLTGKVERMQKGYDTHIGRLVFEDGIELSGGETQRLMLARALYKNAPIIVLDEPTAALDPLAESDIYQKYHDMTGGRTSLYISHRLASTRFCDRIIYLKDGQIKESGTHERLLASGGEYAELFEVQRKYYREGEDNGTEE